MRRRLVLVFVIVANFVLLGHFVNFQSTVNRQIKSLRHEAEALRNSGLRLSQKMDATNHSIQYIMRDLKRNYMQLKELAEHARARFIRIKGADEETGEDLERVVKDVCKHIDINITQYDISRVYRAKSPKGKGTSGVIIVELTSLKLKQQILRKASTGLLDTPYSIQDDVTNHNMPESFAKVEKRDFTKGCGYISSVSKPQTIAKSKKTFGAWLQDPVASPNGERDGYVWILPHFYENNIAEEYANFKDLKHGRVHQKYKLPYNWAGTGHVVYNMSLYFVRFDSASIVRYDLRTEEILKEKSIPNALHGNDAPYQWSGSTDIDLSTDVYGLWAIYATYDNTMDIVLGNIDPVTLEVEKTWRTNWRKQWSGNAFMMCGVLYVLKKYDERTTSLSYTYDTRIKKYRRVQIPFINNYEWNTMLEYNSRTKMIYAWDRGYLVTYNVTLTDGMS